MDTGEDKDLNWKRSEFPLLCAQSSQAPMAVKQEDAVKTRQKKTPHCKKKKKRKCCVRHLFTWNWSLRDMYVHRVGRNKDDKEGKHVLLRNSCFFLSCETQHYSETMFHQDAALESNRTTTASKSNIHTSENPMWKRLIQYVARWNRTFSILADY